jgi:hypothetical protein
LVVATLYTFGLKRGVGVDTISEFFARLHLDTQVGCSPGALRHVMQVLETTAGEPAQTWEQDASAAGEVREIIGGVDETFLERMMVVFQDLPTGYLVLEDVADDRTFAPWHALVDARLRAWGTEVLSLVSDRAKAFMQLAEKGLECLSMPDFFQVVHEIVSSQKFGAESPCPRGLPQRREAGIMARTTRNFSRLEPAALCSKLLTCPASQMNRHANWSEGCSTCWKT